MGIFDRFIGLEGEKKKTIFDSIPFNKDDTNQPYVPVHQDISTTVEQNNLFVKDNFGFQLPPLSPTNPQISGVESSSDFLIRGGLGAASYALEDAYRLNQYFFDNKNPSGLLFTLKQNILSQTGPRTEASRLINGGVYTPYSTILQAGTGFSGVHLNKQGLDPTGLSPFLSIRKYEDVVKRRAKRDDNLTQIPTLPGDEIIEGIGNNLNSGNPTNLYSNRLLKIWDKKQKSKTGFLNNHVLIYPGGPGSLAGVGFTRIKFADRRTGVNSLLFQNNRDKFYGKSSPSNPILSPELLEFPTSIPSSFDKTNNNFDDYVHPDYAKVNIPITYNFTSPGRKGNKSNYSLGKLDPIISGSILGPSDKINAQSIYTSDTPKTESDHKDLVDFRIAVIDNNSDNFKESFYLPFRAYVSDFSDSYSATWKSIDYMGRAEDFYKYDKFKRKLSLSFIVAAQSKQELMVQYEKLNFLASSLAPTYSDEGYMSGNLFKIDFGGYLYNQHCIVNSLSYDFKDSPWEIGMDVNGEEDLTVVQLPHIIQVKMSITPIHDFRVERQRLAFKDEENGGNLSRRGPQNYISRNQLGNNGVARNNVHSLNQATNTEDYNNTLDTIIKNNIL